MGGWLVRSYGFQVPVVTSFAIVAMTLAVATSSGASARDPVRVVITLENDTFTPAEVVVPAGTPLKIKIINKTAAAIEFEAKDLKIEKVMPPKSDATVSVRPLRPGRYLFVNEYKEDKVKGYVVVK
jgi:Cupredoxin-like domain